MSIAVAEEPRVMHAVPGRIRIHVPDWSGHGQRSMEEQLCHVQGVQKVQANSLTGNVLIQFDPQVTNEQALIERAKTLEPGTHEQPEDKPIPPATHSRHGHTIRARIAVRGMDRDPRVARRVVEHLQRRRGVRALASPLTGRVLVEFTEYEADLDDILSDVADVELPDLPGEDRPANPLDPGPFIQGMSRVIGATLGVGLLAVRRLLGGGGSLPGAGVAGQVATVIGILQGIPPVRYGLRRLLGRTVADLAVNIPAIVTLTLSGNFLGLAVTGAESLRLVTEAHARRNAWLRHEERVAIAPSAQPGAIIRLEAGECTALPALIQEGAGTVIGRDGMPSTAIPGSTVPAGARLYGGPFVLKLQSKEAFGAFTPQPRPAPPAPSLYDRYLQAVGPASIIYAIVTAFFTRSINRTLAALLLVSPRTAAIGIDSAELGASARVLRAGVTVVGTRAKRSIQLPDYVLLDNIRLLSDRLELISALPLSDGYDSAELQARAAGVAVAAGYPWGGIFRSTSTVAASDGIFDGKTATAYSEGVCYRLGPVEDWADLPEASRLRQQGNYVLALHSEHQARPLGLFALRPRLAPGVADLVQTCQSRGVELGLLTNGDQIAARAFAHRANIALLDSDNALEIIRDKQQAGKLVAFVSDHAGAAAAFDACDLAIGLTDDRTQLPARADLLAPDLIAVATIIDAGARRKMTTRDAIGVSIVTNIVAGILGLRGLVGVQWAIRGVYLSALTVLGDSWLRLRGGERPGAALAHLVDPHPERWGQRDVPQTLRMLESSEEGLSQEQAEERKLHPPMPVRHYPLVSALLEQLRSPLIGILAAGAGLSFLMGATGDVVIISLTVVANVLVGAWQEYKANRVSAALARIGTSSAQVLRDGHAVTVRSDEIVPGDILLLATGDRVAADARVISAQGLELDEAALTGESFPVPKSPDGRENANRVVLEGSDVTTGTGRAVVVAVGSQTRMGATAAALSANGTEQSPLGKRLASLLRLIIPISVGGGIVVILSGLLRGRPLASLVATGATLTLTGVPEGLPLLTRVSEAAVARRLAHRGAAVRRLSAVEALGRVDVACTDKTGTLTEGHLRLSLVSDGKEDMALPGDVPPYMSHVLLTAALASPHPDAPDASAHPTDIAVIRGAQAAGLDDRIQTKHDAELSFDPVRAFHVTVVEKRLCIKGAPEAIIHRCTSILRQGEKCPLDEAGQQELLSYSTVLAERGLRVLMVAEGAADTPLEHPEGLTAVGFVGISDPLRPNVRDAVRQCHEAGIRVIMITGDHPATARTIGTEAGLLSHNMHNNCVVTGPELAELQNGELAQRLENVSVIARATPLDKLRIVESLQSNGHTVAMTGDGVNDAPALRLASVGVAMGSGGTEVARQTADIVLANDDFASLVDALVEGRSFWRNIRRALGLLLGGNLGELGLVAGASLLGLNFPLTVSQILTMNAITDILPGTAVALQQPEHRYLAGLAREGAMAMDRPLRNDIVRRALASALPSLASYIIMLASAGLPQARSVAYANIVVTQLAQTLDAGRTEGGLTRTVLGAVGGSLLVLFATFAIPSVRSFIGLVMPTPFGWALVGGGALLAVFLSRLLASPLFMRPLATSCTLLPVASVPPMQVQQ